MQSFLFHLESNIISAAHLVADTGVRWDYTTGYPHQNQHTVHRGMCWCLKSMLRGIRNETSKFVCLHPNFGAARSNVGIPYLLRFSVRDLVVTANMLERLKLPFNHAPNNWLRLARWLTLGLPWWQAMLIQAFRYRSQKVRSLTDGHCRDLSRRISKKDILEFLNFC